LSKSRLVLAAHGSADPRFAAVADAVVARVQGLRPGLDVAGGYLEHGPPHLADVVDDDTVVVPMLLASGYHVRVDVPDQAPRARVAAALGPDPRLADALADRLDEAGYDGSSGIVLAAAGSSSDEALAEVHAMAAALAERLRVPVEAAFVSAGSPRVAEVLGRMGAPRVVASYLLAPGAFHDALLDLGADVVSAPIGDHPVVARIVLDRYDDCDGDQVPGRIAPA
jgi:sirohydrochlorin ferrochelatase